MKPLSHEEVTGRALRIVCELMEKLELEVVPGAGPATARQIRRAIMYRARRELLRERKQKRPRTP